MSSNMKCGPKIEKFASETHFHGIKECYFSISLLWKIIWCILIVFSFGVTIYQVYELIQLAQDSQTTTVVGSFTNGQPKYPALKMCFLHWMYWVNCSKAESLGLNKESLLYAISYLLDVTSSTNFSIHQAKINLIKVMEKNNFTTVSQLYDAIAFDQPPGWNIISIKPGITMNPWKKVINPPYDRCFCYVADNSLIQQAMTNQDDSSTAIKNSLQFIFNPAHFQINDCEFFAEEEYYYDVKTFVSHLMVQGTVPYFNASTFRCKLSKDSLSVQQTIENTLLPVLIFMDNEPQTYVLASKGVFKIDSRVDIQVFNWLNRRKKPCKDDRDDSPSIAVPDYLNCETICKAKSNVETLSKNSSACYDVTWSHMFGMDTMLNSCQKDFLFLNLHQRVKGSINDSPTSINDGHQKRLYEDCMERNCNNRCSGWKYRSSSNVSPLPIDSLGMETFLLFTVTYPLPYDVQTLTETYLQTWETIVGNIGGVIGLWLGASMLSIPQVFYLFLSEVCKKRPKKISFKKYKGQQQVQYAATFD